jgi:RNA polymerase sigma-70 factor (ECF subfamily)
MNREELNRLLQTIQDANTAQRFALAQYGTRRNFLSDDGRYSRGTGIGQPQRASIRDGATRHSTENATTNYQLRSPDRSNRMTAPCLESYERKRTGGQARRRTIATKEYAILAAAKRGDSAAFEVLCKQSANTVFRVARRMMRNNEDAEDVVQESFQQAFIHLKSFNGDSRFSTWLSRIAINAALMKLRKKRHLWDVSLDESPESEPPSSRLDVEDQGLNPEQIYAQEEQQRILCKAMEELNPGMRKAIELRELGERSTEETARIMGISISAVKARVFHGRKKLRERLTRYVGSAWTYGRDTSRAFGNTGHLSQDRAACNACD